METRRILNLLDLTLLDMGASERDLAKVCELANRHRTAAVCVFPRHSGFVRDHLEEGIAMALVAGGFPRGSDSPAEIFDAVEDAASKGADEIDCVLEPRDDDSFPGELELAKLIAMREAAQGRILKVILETPLLGERQLRAATRMALSTGADFVKSCTGKRGGCSDEAATILAEEVSRHCLSFEGKPGVKISGGISKREDAARLIALVKGEDESISGSDRLRIGASSLLMDLVDGGLGRN
jgi:deoxyribose-phosphate aldolase